MKSGVYILYDEERGLFKIGMSEKDIDKRIIQVQKTCKFSGIKSKLQVFNIIRVKKARLLEKHLHMLLNCWRYQNEFFKCSENVVNTALFKIDLNYAIGKTIKESKGENRGKRYIVISKIK